MAFRIYENEELLSEENNRYVLFPIKYQDIWSMCKKQKLPPNHKLYFN